MMVEQDKKTNRRESWIAILVVAAQFLTWLFVTLHFFDSPYSTVSDLSGFVFGFPIVSMVVHIFIFRMIPRETKHRRDLAKYAVFHVVFLTCVSYLGLFVYIVQLPYK